MASIHILVMDSLEDTQRIPSQKSTNSLREGPEEPSEPCRSTRILVEQA